MITRICKQCGKEYSTYPSINKTYCSHRCASDAKIKGSAAKCEQCGKSFWRNPSRKVGKYCSKSCAITARNLTSANPSFYRDISGDKNPMYGVSRYGKDNPMFGNRKEKCALWRGGKRTRKDGYVRIAVPDDYPFPSEVAVTGTKYALEHRVVVEQSIGRYLTPEEVVHHIDGNPSNNAIDNLKLFGTQAEHMETAHRKK